MSFKRTNSIRGADDAVNAADRDCEIISAANSTENGGVIRIWSGWSDPSDTPGSIDILTTEASSGTPFDSGNITMQTGGGGFDGYSLGFITIRTGGGESSPWVTGTGDLNLSTGSANAATNCVTTGDINIFTGGGDSATAAFTQTGTIEIRSGSLDGATPATQSGDVRILTGSNGSAASAISGEILLQTGSGDGGDETGPIRLVTGNGGSVTSGDIMLQTGSGAGGDVGNVSVTFGGRGTGNGGRMYMVVPETFGAGRAQSELVQAIGYAEVQ